MTCLKHQTNEEHAFLVTTLPKSGTVYLISFFTDVLGCRWLGDTIFSGTFPDDVLNFRVAEENCYSNSFGAGHFPPSRVNMQVILGMRLKTVVQIRDPRASLISWIHQAKKLIDNNQPNALLKSYPYCPVEVFGSSLNCILDWHIEHYLPVQCEWLASWISEATKYPELLYTSSFEEMASTPLSYFQRVCSFLDKPVDLREQDFPDKHTNAHFRSGKIREFEDVMSSDQIQKCNKIMARHSLTQFVDLP